MKRKGRFLGLLVVAVVCVMTIASCQENSPPRRIYDLYIEVLDGSGNNILSTVDQGALLGSTCKVSTANGGADSPVSACINAKLPQTDISVLHFITGAYPTSDVYEFSFLVRIPAIYGNQDKHEIHAKWRQSSQSKYETELIGVNFDGKEYLSKRDVYGTLYVTVVPDSSKVVK